MVATQSEGKLPTVPRLLRALERKPLTTAILAILALTSVGIGIYAITKTSQTSKDKTSVEFGLSKNEATVSAFDKLVEEAKESTDDESKTPTQPKKTQPAPTPKENLPEISIPKPFSILLLGYDRRSKAESPYRTDVIMLISLSQDKSKLLLTSIPRDLWIDGARINAFFAQGTNVMKQKVQKITSFPVDRYVGIDFEDYKWLVNFFGGVEVNVERAFTDSSYPTGGDDGIQTIHFDAGFQRLNGEQALKYARSRKGDNNEGSDFARAARQQKVILALANSIPAKCSGDEATCFSAIANRVDTDLTLNDVNIFLEAVSRVGSMRTSRVVLDYNYLYNPPMEEYGGAWVIVPIDPSYQTIHNLLSGYLK